MKPLPYKHFFHVENGKYIWEDKSMFELKKRMLEGKRGFAIIEEEEEDASRNQLTYYFGGIIRKECMSSECFAGWKEGEIHNHLLKVVRGTIREIHLPKGKTKIAEMIPDFELIRRNKKDMSSYIQEVIAKLNTEYDIFPKPAEHYKTNKFHIDTKTYK
jgi:hypothetical protein